MNAPTLFTMAPLQVFRPLKRWWMQRKVNHFVACADVERDIADQAMKNARYYERKAMMVKADMK